MTPQEIYWKNKVVLVTGVLSKSGKVHIKLKSLIGFTGTVLGESKNNQLLVEFTKRNKDGNVQRFTRCVPSGCVTMRSGIKGVVGSAKLLTVV